MQSQYRSQRSGGDPGEPFVECSSSPFGLASSPVSLKPSRSRPLPAAQNESTAFSESLRGGRAHLTGDLENWVRCIPPSTR